MSDFTQNRTVFRKIADPIKNYFVENGIDEMGAGVMAANLAERIMPSLETILEVKPKEEKK